MARTASTEDVCAALGVNERTLRRWKGRGCPHDPPKKGKALLWDVDEVRAWRDAHGLGAPGGPPEERQPAGPAPPSPGASDQPAPAGAAPGPRDQLNAARARKAELEVEQRQLQLAQARGQLVPLEEVRAFFEGQVALVKAHVAALPGRLAPQFVEQPYEEIHARLERALDSMLEAFAAGELPGPVEPASTHLEPQPHGGALLRYDQKGET